MANIHLTTNQLNDIPNIIITKDAFLNTNATPNTYIGYNVSQIYKAYGYDQLPKNVSSNVHIAIVIAYHYPKLQSDFDKFCQLNNLPLITLNIVKINPNTPNGAGWDEEICLDTQWTHAICPYAKISVVEAASASLTDMLIAIQVANSLNPHIVSMSWGASEFSQITLPSLNVFNSNILYVASSGDSGTVEWPASNPNVLSVGGTSLYVNSAGNYKQEQAWNSSGCGYSKYFPIPSYQQKNLKTTSKYRATVDISSVGNPSTGCYVYFNGKYNIYGGTSLSAPIIAGTMAIVIAQRLSKKLSALNSNPSSPCCVQNILYNYYKTSGVGIFNDITVGNVGSNVAQVGYDIPSGLGSPRIPTFLSYLSSSSGALISNYGYGVVTYMDHHNSVKNTRDIQINVSHNDHDELLRIIGFVEKNKDETFHLHIESKNASVPTQHLTEKNINEADIPNIVSKYVEQITRKHFQS
jgi:subtilase family serine protease